MGKKEKNRILPPVSRYFSEKSDFQCVHGVPFDSECKECQEVNSSNKYKRKVPRLDIDVYDVLKAFNVVNPATQHAIKKLLCAGDRGYKDKVQDLKEAYDSIGRAIELDGDNVEK